MKLVCRPVIAAGALLTLLLCSPISAQDLPDPATIELPDLSVADDPKAVEEGYKFFYFHNPSVSFEEAYRDISDCRSYLPGRIAALPTFIPWVEPKAITPQVPRYNSPYGPMGDLVNAAIAAIVVPKIQRGKRNNKMRMCMEPRGYARYPVSEASWEILNEGDEGDLILMQAKIASGPTPDAAPVTEVAE